MLRPEHRPGRKSDAQGSPSAAGERKAFLLEEKEKEPSSTLSLARLRWVSHAATFPSWKYVTYCRKKKILEKLSGGCETRWPKIWYCELLDQCGFAPSMPTYKAQPFTAAPGHCCPSTLLPMPATDPAPL